MGEDAGLHQGEGTWVPADVRERGQLRSHPQEEEEVVQERGLCSGGRLRVRLRLRGLRLLPEEDEVLHLPASVALGGARAPARAEARPAPSSPPRPNLVVTVPEGPFRAPRRKRLRVS